MMKNAKLYCFLTLLLVTGPMNLQAQDELQNPYTVAKEDGFGYRSLRKLLEMESLYIGSQFERPYHDLMSILYSRVGHYNEAMQRAEKGSVFSDKTRFAHHFKEVKLIPLSEVMAPYGLYACALRGRRLGC